MNFIGKYEILDEIGSGAAGTTYRARDNFRNREVVVRVLRGIPTLEASVKQEYCRELLACSELQHRHLAKVIDLGEVEGRIYIATELLTGGDLRNQAAKHREMPVAQKVGILAQASEGLGFAHSRGIVHGAIKPSNIFVDSNNDVTIVDFGTAKWLSLILAGGSRPEGLRPDYFAPEQILGQAFDTRSDLFSLGLTAYEFLAGQYPFQVPPSLIPREIVHSELPALRSFNPEIPEELERLLGRAIEKNPDQRIQTAEEFAAGLYSIAQQLRRVPVVADLAEPALVPSVPVIAADAARSTTVPVPIMADTAFSMPVAEPAAPAFKRGGMESILLAAQTVPAPQTVAEPPQEPLPVPVESAPEATSVAAPLKTPPPASKRIARKAPSPKTLKRRIIAIAAGAILAIYAVLNFVSHQGLHASQAVNQNPASSLPKAA